MKDEILKLIASAQKTNHIPDLCDISLKITGYLVYLSEQESEAHTGYLKLYDMRKTQEARITLENASEGLGKAQTIAKQESAELRQSEIEAEALHKEYLTFRVTVQNFIASLQQKISYLKLEYQNKD